MPMNYLLMLSLQTYGAYYTDKCDVEYPAGSGSKISLSAVANELSKR
jgi:hypothetical protein